MNCKPFIFLILCFVLSFSSIVPFTAANFTASAAAAANIKIAVDKIQTSCIADNAAGEAQLEKEWTEENQELNELGEEFDINIDQYVNAPTKRLLQSTQTGKNPCTPPKVAKKNSVSIVTNGCGSKSWQKPLLFFAFPVSAYFGSCCNSHDRCYSICTEGKTDSAFQSYRDKCDASFKSCMLNTCTSLAKKKNIFIRIFWRAWCKANAVVIARIVARYGGEAFNKSQKKYCDCVKP